MKTSSIVLMLYGHDPALLETRKWVLQTRGYHVAQITGLAEIDRVALKSDVRLLILCHPLSAAETKAALNRATARWPEVKHVVLGAADSRYPTGVLGGLLYTKEGPGKLLMMVKELLEPEAPLAGVEARAS